jgi:lactoylglutathione lyase
MRLGYTILYVRDVLAAADFYERAFGLEPGYVAPEGHYAELKTGTTKLAFVTHEQAGPNLPGGFTPVEPAGSPPGFEIALVTDDVAAGFARAVEAGAVALAEPAEKPWGQTVAFVRDPEGFLVEICTEP